MARWIDFQLFCLWRHQNVVCIFPSIFFVRFARSFWLSFLMETSNRNEIATADRNSDCRGTNEAKIQINLTRHTSSGEFRASRSNLSQGPINFNFWWVFNFRRVKNTSQKNSDTEKRLHRMQIKFHQSKGARQLHRRCAKYCNFNLKSEMCHWVKPFY